MGEVNPSNEQQIEQLTTESSPLVKREMDIAASLENLQTNEQRRVLDTVAQVRKCGLESILSLPQLVVCGDQSAGKSSVLEALTEIPFPRSDNLCTRFATEIILRRENTDSLTIKIIPDEYRPAEQKAAIKNFRESIVNFADLPKVMDAAKAVMDKGNSQGPTKAFAKDVLSIEIEGPTRPQLTLVDIPGLIQTDTKGTTKADVELVAEITDQYIQQPRTICLAVVSAAYDCANQRILTKARHFDAEGDRTLGIITKPDLLPSGSGSESEYLGLARNNNIFFKLGWHVLKNRKFDEREYSLLERNASEDHYFRTSNFKNLPKSNLGIDTLKSRLSQLLFEHIKRELPKLRDDLEEALVSARKQLENMGDRRTEPEECKAYLTELSLKYSQICRAAVDGHYEDSYFKNTTEEPFDLASSWTIRRLRAVVQYANSRFSEKMRVNGHRYQIDIDGKAESADTSSSLRPLLLQAEVQAKHSRPTPMTKDQALAWVRDALVQNRGKELVGNFNPLLVGVLLWKQCSKWHRLAEDYVDEISGICDSFHDILLEDRCSKDVISRLRISLVQDELKIRHENALEELNMIMDDVKNYPINYNHYYTDTISKRRKKRQEKSFTKHIEDATTRKSLSEAEAPNVTFTSLDVGQILKDYTEESDASMENISCEEALDCLEAIYKVQLKTFVANITTQVIERHIVRGMETIFNPKVVNRLSNAEAEGLASEPAAAQRQRQFLEDRVTKLKEGQGIFRRVLGGAA